MNNTELYRAAQARMTALAQDADGNEPVAACPGWNVRDLLAHVTGAAADLAEGRLDGVGTDAWTAVQVRARGGRTLADVLAEWTEVSPRMEEALEVFGGAPAQLVFDTVTHELDLQHALGVTGPRDAESLGVALAWVVEAWRRSAPQGPGTLRLVAGDLSVDLGDGEPMAVVALSPFEALRALTGRRSADQLDAYDASTPIDPWLGAFTWGPFAARAERLDEG